MTALSRPGRLLPALDLAWYVDPEIFAREQRAIFAQRWNLVGRSTEIPEPGAYITVSVAEDNVIVTRQEDGSVAAMLNVCRHRGARILLQIHPLPLPRLVLWPRRIPARRAEPARLGR
jgi:Rieske 2Fe-2S family protein